MFGVRARRRTVADVALGMPAVILVTVGALVPVILTVARSASGDAYGELFDDPLFWRSIRSTLVIAVETTALCLVIGFPVAFWMTKFRSSIVSAILLITTLSMLTSVLVRSYAWSVILGRNGLVNTALTKSGLLDSPLGLMFNRTSVVIAMTHYLLPYMLLTLYAGMRTLDHSLLAASRTLGASGFATFRRVLFPLVRPAVFAGSTLVFVLATGFYVIPALLGSGGDSTVAMYIDRQLQQLDWGRAAAAATLLLGATLVLFVLLSRVMRLDRVYASMSK